MVIIANLIADIIEKREEAFESVKAQVAKLIEEFPLYANDIM